MRRLALTLSFVAFMPAAYASQWKLMNEQRLIGNTPDQIRMNLDRDQSNRFEWLRRATANALIVNQRIPAVVGMNVLVRTYHWEGLSICDDADPRLTRETDSGAMQFANGETRSWNFTLEEKDPCAFPYTDPERQFTVSRTE